MCRSFPSAISVRWLGALLIILLSAVTLGGCAIRLAPSHDASLVQGLEQTTEKTMGLFAEVADGAERDTYPDRAAAYNEIIGKAEALRLSALVRPVPPPSFLSKSDTGSSVTPEILIEVIKTVRTMQRTDRTLGLRSSLVQGFKQSFETSMAQALFYEKALQR
ncbi:hypothetical protein VSX64_20225 [Aurantimonas sp. C2-6-R+9]|uniref:hypothetical protein n=1 Tax=unclassified Aurantimonas TaxID=2638230 RepID=UPI002E18B90A|nr:hypothetical protein [Aurantimonas sp. C2-6-R+9]